MLGFFSSHKPLKMLGSIVVILTLITIESASAETMTSSDNSETVQVEEPLQSPPICSTVRKSRKKSTAKERSKLLRSVKSSLLTEANRSVRDLQLVRDYIVKCDHAGCKNFHDKFLETLHEQLDIAKMVKAISARPHKFRGHTRSPKTVQDLLLRIQNDRVYLHQIANFDLRGFKFNSVEEEKTKNLWTKVFVDIAQKSPKDMPLLEVLKQVKIFFKKMSNDLLDLNPLLAFVTEESMEDPEVLVNGIDKMIEFNKEFLSSADGLGTSHKTGLFSYPNLSLPDHEMGLVNFTKLTEKLIRTTSTNRNELIRNCRAWEDLKTQKGRRVWSSIGVGFGTAFVCAVGSWSGVGIPWTATRCSFALADGLWGATQGYRAASISENAFYAGRTLSPDGRFSKGFLSAKESRSQTREADIVFIVNAMGIFPVAKAIAKATRGGRGKFRELAVIPSADVMVSSVEAKASNIAYAMLVVRSGELFRDDLNQQVQELLDRK